MSGADTDTDTMPEPGYNIGNAACVVANSGLFTAAAVKMARLAIAEHERAEALARRVAELEKWQADITTAVEAMTGRKVEHFASCDWCGACSPEDADGRCEPREDETGERSCPGIEGPVAEVWDDGANAVVLMLREEMQHAAIIDDESKRIARRVAELEAELSDLRPLAVGRRLPGEAVGRCAETVCAREDELEAANADD